MKWPQVNYICETCNIGYLEIDPDSFETNIEEVAPDLFTLSASVKGYCNKCTAEHTFSINGPASVKVNI